MNSTSASSVYLLRHGATEWSSTGRHTSRTDIPLTREGERRAVAAGRVLAALRAARPGPAVLVSPRQRAWRTAELAKLPGPEVEPLLAEWDYGEYEGMSTAQIREMVPEWTVWTHQCPGGEDAENVSRRADALLERVRSLLDGSDVVLCGHGHFSRVLIARWLGLNATDGVRFALDAAAISVLGHERGVPQLGQHNLPPWENQAV